jgi:H+-transporting two-sector ATPase, C subunit
MKDIAFTLTYAIPGAFAAIGCGWIGASAMKAAGRNPEKINDLRTMMILGISFIDALAIIGFVAAIVGKVM